MAYSNGIISAPVVIPDDVNAALGTSLNDLSALCASANINMWAKYKPVINTDLFTDSQWDATNQTWLASATWWQGTSLMVGGITPSKSNSLATIIGNYNGALNGWSYQRPSGGVLAPYRLTDFAKYNHNAHAPVMRFSVPAKVKVQGKFMVSCMLSDDDLGLHMSDLKYQGSALYFGVAITDTSNNILYKVTASQTNMCGFMVILPSSISAGTTVRVYPFLSTARVNNDSPSAVYFTVPGLNYATMVVATNSLNLPIKAIYTSSAKTSVQVSITNNDLTDRTVNMHLRFSDATDYNTPDMRSGELSASVTATAGQTVTYTFTGLSASQQYVLYCYVSAPSGDFYYTVYIMSESED